MLQTTVILALLYLSVKAGELVKAGNLPAAAALGVASSVLLFFFVIEILIKAFNVLGMAERSPLYFSYGKNATFKDAFAFIAGFLLLVFIAGTTQSVAYNPSFSVFSQAAASLSPNDGLFLVTVAAPVAEEAFFLIAFPALLWYFIKGLGKTVKSGLVAQLLLNDVVYIGVAAVTTGVLFAYFHVGQSTLISFIFASAIFRAVLVVLATSDYKFDLLPGLSAFYAFAVGVHMSNNVNATVGYWRWFTEFLPSVPFGLITAGILGTIVLLALLGLKRGKV